MAWASLRIDQLRETARLARARYKFYRGEAQWYRERARFPKNNEPLVAGGTDPIANDNGRVHREKAGPGGEAGPLLVLSAPQATVTYPDPIVVEAWVLESSERVTAEVTAELTKGPPHPFPDRVQLEFRDDGLEGDRVAGDLIYTWRFAPTNEDEADRWSGLHNIYVNAYPQGTDTRRLFSAIGWEYSGPPGAELTGEYRDSIKDGNLLIEAEVLASKPGRYHVQMTLYAGEEPLAWAQNENVAELPSPGRYWLPVSVYGLLINERHLDGPYTVRRIWLRNVTTMPPKSGTMLENVYTTAAYRAEDFTDKPFNDPIDLEKARVLEDQARETAAEQRRP